ncbi:MAG: hypothetical protein LC641_05995, partial [Spirochaeta sp.]|nr:hypothetical protein [Spirochaeta sp.]
MKKANRRSAYIKLGLLIVGAVAIAGCQFGMEAEKDDPLASIDSFVEFYAPSYRSFEAVAQAERIAPTSSSLSSGGISATATLT